MSNISDRGQMLIRRSLLDTSPYFEMRIGPPGPPTNNATSLSTPAPAGRGMTLPPTHECRSIPLAWLGSPPFALGLKVFAGGAPDLINKTHQRVFGSNHHDLTQI